MLHRLQLPHHLCRSLSLSALFPLFGLGTLGQIFLAFVANDGVGGIVELQAALAFIACAFWRLAGSLFLSVLLHLMGGLNTVSFIALRVKQLLPALLSQRLPLLRPLHFLGAVLLQGDDVFPLALQLLVGLRVDDELLLDDQIDENLLLLPVQVVGAGPAVQYFVVGVGEVEAGSLALPQLDQLEGPDAGGAMQWVFLLLPALLGCAKAKLVHFLALAPHYIIMAAMKGLKITLTRSRRS